MRRDKAEKVAPKGEVKFTSVDDRSWTRIFDYLPGAWQTHSPYTRGENSVLANPTVFSCHTLIENDVGKLPFCVEQESQGVWTKVDHDILKLLKQPNKFQNQIQFRKNWISSKLLHGNTYTLKFRDRGGKIIGLIILDPLHVTPLVASNGDIYYQITGDDIHMVEGSLIVPSSEVIHDRWNCLFHPLVGLTPLFAGAVSAQAGNSILNDSKQFFAQGAKPSGTLTAPGNISDETANRLKEYFETAFSGDKAGKIAVLGDGLQYQAMRMTSVDAQLMEQLGWTDEKICSVYHVPRDMVGVGESPAYNNSEILTLRYYSQCLQDLIESMEESLNRGLGIQPRFRVQLDLDHLFRMDQATLVKTINEGVGGGWMAPDEGRRKFNLPPVPGGKHPYLQQQNYSLEALAKRDSDDPFAKPEPAAPPVEPEENEVDEQAMMFAYFVDKELKGETART